METQTNPLAESFIWGWVLLATGLILNVEIMAMIGPIMVACALIGGAIATHVN